VSGVIAVNDVLAAWSRERLHVPSDRVWYIPNFAEMRISNGCPELPGRKGARIVHVANLRPQKDHLTLLRAFAAVVQRVPDAHLLLAGAAPDAVYHDFLRVQIQHLGVSGRVTMLGSRNDIPDLLASCDIGVLSSTCEGLPVSLLEYGAAGLPAVCSAVGQCPEVLDRGAAGILFPGGDVVALADALINLLQSPDRRSALGRCLLERVSRHYSQEGVVQQVCEIYETVLQR